MKRTASFVLLYGLLVLVGGSIGYVQAKSTPSLVSGLIFGIGLLLAAMAMYKKKRAGAWIALIISILLEGFFTWRFSKTLHFFPSGLMSLMSWISIIILALKIKKTATLKKKS